MQNDPEAANHVELADRVLPPPPPPEFTKPPTKRWDESSTNPAVMPADASQEKIQPTEELPSDEKPPLSPIPPRTSSLENLMTVDRPPATSPRSPVGEKPMPPSPLTRRFSTNLDPHSPADPTPPPPAPDPEPPQPRSRG
ncbi:hypothetical protein ABW21_db0202459 [Orbilia brochopaga]|nr:hypothetical protein ABW21_db0202459 [Drechslerella brochopaga]